MIFAPEACAFDRKAEKSAVPSGARTGLFISGRDTVFVAVPHRGSQVAEVRQYEVKSRNLVIGDERPKGYLRADLADAWAIYLPSPDKSATSATSAPDTDLSEEKAAESLADIADVARGDSAETADKTAKVADVAEVADVAGSGDEEVF